MLVLYTIEILARAIISLDYQGPLNLMVRLLISHMGDQGLNLGGSKNFSIVEEGIWRLIGPLGEWPVREHPIEEIHSPKKIIRLDCIGTHSFFCIFCKSAN